MVNGLIIPVIPVPATKPAIYLWVTIGVSFARVSLKHPADRQWLDRAFARRRRPAGRAVSLRRRLAGELAGDAADQILGYGVCGRQHRHVGAQQIMELRMPVAERLQSL